ncbi:hypothetical protein BKA70DRAFT_1060352, partial [Coprinopsis sp. MPI-PUGE-AT-0042]
PQAGDHPCSIPRDQLRHTKEELANLVNRIERHSKCMPGYCQVKRKSGNGEETHTACRFDFPMNVRDEPGIGFDSKGRVRFEPRRNDPLMNTHIPAAILAWRANLDFRPVLSKEA